LKSCFICQRYVSSKALIITNMSLQTWVRIQLVRFVIPNYFSYTIGNENTLFQKIINTQDCTHRFENLITSRNKVFSFHSSRDEVNFQRMNINYPRFALLNFFKCFIHIYFHTFSLIFLKIINLIWKGFYMVLFK
jgi:hypothetical protein